MVVKSRLLDVAKSLETTPEENLRMARETIECLQDNGLEVFVDFEHAMDADCGRRENGTPPTRIHARSRDYFRQLTEQCVHQGVSRIVVCDTTGGANPEEVLDVIGGLPQQLSRAQGSASTAIPTAASASPTPAPPFSPARSRCRARSSAPASAAAT